MTVDHWLGGVGHVMTAVLLLLVMGAIPLGVFLGGWLYRFNERRKYRKYVGRLFYMPARSVCMWREGDEQEEILPNECVKRATFGIIMDLTHDMRFFKVTTGTDTFYVRVSAIVEGELECKTWV